MGGLCVMRVVALLLGAPLVGQAIRLVPEVSTLSRGPWGLPSVPYHVVSSLRASVEDEVADPFGVREASHENTRPLPGLELQHPVDMDPEPISMSEVFRKGSKKGARAPYTISRMETESGPKIIKRVEVKTPQHLFAARNEAKAIAKTLDRNVFLTLQQAWTTQEQGDPAEFVYVSENYAGNLRDLMEEHYGELDMLTVLDLLVDVSDDLGILRRLNIAHVPPGAEDILIVGDLKKLSTCRAVLTSSLTNTRIRVRSFRAMLKRLLTLKGRKNPNATLRSWRDIQKADFDALVHLLDQLIEASHGDDARRLYRFAQSEGSTLQEFLQNVRKEWLHHHAHDDDSTRSGKRLQPGRTLLRPWRKPKGGKGSQDAIDKTPDEAVQTAVDVAELVVKEDLNDSRSLELEKV